MISGSVSYSSASVFKNDQNEKSEPEIKYGGTGFLVHETTKLGIVIPYLVTARHVAERLDVDFVIRANLKDGGVEEIPLESTEWLYPEDPCIDIAVTPYTLLGQRYDHYYHPVTDIPPPQQMVMCGDPVAIVGLFRLRFGSARNFPIVHSGHVAALADRKEPIPSRNTSTDVLSPIVAHLVEVQTLDGLSGSPVFVQGFVHFPQYVLPTDKTHPSAFGSSKLFGIYHGSWDGEPGTILAKDRDLGGNRNIRVPIGMGIVTPAEELITLIQNHPVLKKKRRELHGRR